MGKNFIERLQYYMELKGINDNQMTVAAGLSVGLLGKLKKNGKGMNSSNIEKVLCSYPDLNAAWLLTGEGEMLKNTTPGIPTELIRTDPGKGENYVPQGYPLEAGHNCQIEKNHQVTKDSQEGIPLIPLSAVAGFPAIDEAGVFIESCERYRIPEFEAKGAQFLIRVSGDSMMPTYQNGDIIACRKLSDILFFQWGNIYVIDSSQGQLVKRIFECQDDAEHIRCVSDNTKYPPFNIPTTDIRSLSIIIGLLRIV